MNSPDSPDFKHYLREYESQGVGKLLYALILGLVGQTIKHYPPEIYSPNEIWDEDAISALCHDFTMEKLLRKGWLEYHLLTQQTIAGLTQVLTRDFRHFLISRRKRSVYLNLFKRVKTLLRNDHSFKCFYPHQKSIATVWGLSKWEEPELAQELDEVLAAMFAVRLPPLVRYRADSKKLSHLLSNDDLGRLLEESFEALGKCITLQLLMESLRYRLDLVEIDIVSLDEPIGKHSQVAPLTYADVVPDSTSPSREVSATLYAEDIYERLTDRQRGVVALRLSRAGSTLEQIGDRIGVSKSTVHNDLATVAELVDAADLTQKEAEELLSHLCKLCLRHIERLEKAS